MLFYQILLTPIENSYISLIVESDMEEQKRRKEETERNLKYGVS